MKLGKYLKDNRITDEEFGQKVGATTHAVGKWRRGERRPRDGFMRKIVLVTAGSVSPNDFMSFEAAS